MLMQVLANDLNPNSYRYLQQNIQLNKVQSKVEAYNMDGRGFVRHLCSSQPVIPAASGIAHFVSGDLARYTKHSSEHLYRLSSLTCLLE